MDFRCAIEVRSRRFLHLCSELLGHNFGEATQFDFEGLRAVLSLNKQARWLHVVVQIAGTVDHFERGDNILKWALNLVVGQVGDLMLLHIEAQISTVHPLSDQVDILVVLDDLDHFRNIVRSQLQLAESLSEGQLWDRIGIARGGGGGALGRRSHGSARVSVDYLNSDFGAIASVFGLDDGEGSLTAFLIVHYVLIDLVTVPLLR